MKARASRPAVLAGLTAALLALAPAGTASAGLIGPGIGGAAQLDAHFDRDRFVALKRKASTMPPEVLTAHTNQPPAPPGPPADPLLAPPGGGGDRPWAPRGSVDPGSIELGPGLAGRDDDGPILIDVPLFPVAPAGGVLADVIGPDPTDGTSFVDAGPALVPGPGGLLLLLGAGLGVGRRRRG